jgi:uncharacterized DUF497 family protein
MTQRDESKRRKNIRDHGIDFLGCEAIWDNFTITREDVRQAYTEQRLVTFGILDGCPVVMVHAERAGEPRIISLRKAEKHEARYYFAVAQRHFERDPGHG